MDCMTNVCMTSGVHLVERISNVSAVILLISKHLANDGWRNLETEGESENNNGISRHCVIVKR